MVGILGGGQLSVFLVEAARRLGHRTRVLVTDEKEPATKVADETVLDRGMGGAEGASATGAPAEPDPTLAKFFQGLKHVLFESENIDLDRIEAAAKGTATQGHTARFVPSLDAMRTLQDKGLQKRLLDRLGLPSAAFWPLPIPVTEIELAALDPIFPQGWILKRARGGYDGRGNWLGLSRAEGFEWAKKVQAERMSGRYVEVYAEARVEIARELALIAARRSTGEFVAYPAVVTVQTNGICDTATGPARALGLSSETEARLVEITRAIAEEMDYVGTIAVEFFETAGGEVLVNEIAPRVHNSGHFSIEAANYSQFELHLRAATDVPLPPIETPEYFRMKNCLGPRDLERKRPDAAPGGELWGRVAYHDYGKTEVRPGRKLGHLTVHGPLAERDALDRELEEAHARWIAGVPSGKV